MGSRRMSPRDSLWLVLDRPDNLMAITSVLWTSTPVDPGRLRAVIEERLLGRYPVLRRRAVLHGGAVRRADWVDDDTFDLDRHLVVGRVPEPGDRAALERFVAEQRSVPLDPAHPLWRMHLLQGYGGGSALVQRYHHALADGVRLTQVMLQILESPEGGHGALVARVGGRTPVAELPGSAGALVTALRSVTSAVKIALWTEPASVLHAPPGVPKTAAWTDPVPLPVLSDLARATGTSVNDVAVTLVAGAVARWLADHGRPLPADDDDLAWMVPVNLEPPGAEPPPELGNHFALVLAVLPHGTASFRARLDEVHRRITAIRGSWEPVLTSVLARAMAVSPSPVGTAAARLLTSKAVGVLTNVPGPRERMTLAGAPVAGVVGWAPCSGSQTLTVCVFSYAGEVTVGFGTDAGVVPDARQLVSAFEAELASATEAVSGPGAPAGRRPVRSAAGRAAPRPRGR